MKTIITTILRLAISLIIGIIFMMFRICLAGAGESSSTGSQSHASTSNNRPPNKIKIDNDWYQVREECTGELKLKKDWGSSTETVKYTARKPYPVLHSNLYFIYDTYGNKLGEFRNA